VAEKIGQEFCHHMDSLQVHCDSQNIIHLAKDHMYHKQTKHIDVKYHKIHQRVIND